MSEPPVRFVDVLLVLAVVTGMLALTVWSRAGRSEVARWWTGSRSTEVLIVCVLPGLIGMCGLGLAMGAIDETYGIDDLHPVASAAVVLLLGVPFFACMLFCFWGIVTYRPPERGFPAWAWKQSVARTYKRKRDAKRRERHRRRAARKAERAGADG